MLQRIKDILISCKAEPDVEEGEFRRIEMSTVPTRPVPTTPVAISISKVRRQLRRVDEDAFTPHSVLIGLYNYRKGLSQCTGMKEQAVREMRSRDHEGVLMVELQNLEEEARMCFAQAPNRSLSSKQFSNMLLHDGCFLLFNFLDYTGRSEPENSAETAAVRILKGAVVRDTVFLLENQIPFCVLQKIHDVVTGGVGEFTVVEELAVYVQELLQSQLYISKKLQPAPRQSSHLLHLVHAYFKPSNLPTEMDEKTAFLTGRWRRATEYRCQANIRFKRKDLDDTTASSILDVSYQGGTLWIPRLRVDSNTWTILRNLMALEEQILQRPVTAYCVFLSQVAGTVEDVKLLVGAGIVQQFLASENQLAQDFANLLTGVVLDVDNPDENYLKPIWHDLDMRCNKWVYRLMGTCREQHCRNGLYTIAFIITAIIFASGLLQAVFTVLSYKFKD